MDAPETLFTRIGDQRIAYQVVGDGPRDLVLVSGWFSNVDGIWEEPSAARFLRRLATFSRLILFDRRGTGASDAFRDGPSISLEDWADDVRVVMDAAGSDRAAILAMIDGGRMAMMLAATFPERVSALILANSGAKFSQSDDYPEGVPEAGARAYLKAIEDGWGTGVILEAWAPTRMGDDEFRHWWARYQRMSASPAMGVAAFRMAIAIDVRHVLPVIRVPTLILQRESNPLVSTSHGHFLNEHITNSKYVELPGGDFFLFTHEPQISLEEIEEFVTGSRPQIDFDRMLATVLFTDIVGSTELLSEMGDRAWRKLLDRHHAAIRAALARFGGREIDTAGDGFLATFDGPARAIRCACAARDAVKELGISIRAGLHTGEVELRGNDVAGITVHTGARVAALAEADEVLVSSTVADLVGGAGITFEERGTHMLKGVQGEWALLAVTSV